MKKLQTEKWNSILGYVIAICLMLGCLMVPNLEARASALTIGLSSSSVKIGDKVTVTVTVPAGVSATINLTYPTDLFKFSSASDTANANGGTVTMTLGSYGASDSKTSGTVTFTAQAAGSGRFAVTAPTAGNQEGDRVSVGGASAAVTVKNESGGTNEDDHEEGGGKSADNSLASLTLSAGVLQPSFQYDITNYTAEVANDVTSVVVSATPSSPGATIESVTGGEDLAVGENKIQVVVKAENGVTAAYTITVTRKAAGEEETDFDVQDNSPGDETGTEDKLYYELDGVKLYLSETLSESMIPDGFVQGTITLQGREYPCVYSTIEGSSLCLLYLVDENGENGAWYMVAEDDPNYIYPFVLMNYEQYMHLMQEEIEETEDTQMEETVVKKAENEKKLSQKKIFICIFIAVAFIFLILILLLMIKNRNKWEDMDELEDPDDKKDPEKPEKTDASLEDGVFDPSGSDVLGEVAPEDASDWRDWGKEALEEEKAQAEKEEKLSEVSAETPQTAESEVPPRAAEANKSDAVETVLEQNEEEDGDEDDIEFIEL